MEEDLFTRFGRFGDSLLTGLARGERRAAKFKYLIGVVDETLLTTHRMVLSRLRELQQADTPEKALSVIDRLRSQELTEAFRVEGICDLLEGLATGLNARAWSAESAGDYTAEELAVVHELAANLENREVQVAELYSALLKELIHDVSTASVAQVHEHARSLEERLTAQVSDFKAKADRFKRVSV